MHRSRLSVLVIFAGLAACSTRESEATAALATDPTLTTQLADGRKAQQLPLPDACSSIAMASPPAAATKQQASTLAKQAYDAELVGRVQDARALLLRAATLDQTDRTAAYHLARTSETLGDNAAAVTAYCRYLSLAPTAAESMEARQRVASLSQPGAPMAVATATVSAPAVQRVAGNAPRRSTRVMRASRPVSRAPRAVATAPADEPARVATRERYPYSMDTTSSRGVEDAPARTYPQTSAGDVEPAPAPTVSRGPSRVQSAGIGAIAGAIMGAAAGRSVKSAVIGAAAGGVLGTVVGGTTRSSNRTNLRRYGAGW